MIRMMCEMRLVDKMSTDVLRDRVSVVVKIEDMMTQSRLRWYVHVNRQDINSQILEEIELEITWKRNKSRPRKLWEECINKNMELCGYKREDA